MKNRHIWRIHGGSRLSGTVPLHGNKNAALPSLAASLLLPVGTSLSLDHVPRISDVDTMLEILAVYGVRAQWTGTDSVRLQRENYPLEAPLVPQELASRIRGSIVLLGALASQYGQFRLAKPGGDRIGGRPITAHRLALEDVGFQITDQPGMLLVRRTTNELLGGTILLLEQSVTATLQMLLYSACLSPHQHLTLIGAACEPHVMTLCRVLMAMGATIEGFGSTILTVRWPQSVLEPSHAIRLDDDFMEATTYAAAAALTKSDLTIPFQNAGVSLHLLDRYFQWLGIDTTLTADAWHISGSTSSYHIDPALKVIKAEPWPRFPTDSMSVCIVLATQCTGSLKFLEYMYDDRFGFIQGLRDAGARIDLQPPHAITVHGPTPLRGNESFLRPDIRSGAAMLLAALVSSGTTILHDQNGVIERGYHRLPQTLASLGAQIEEVTSPF